MTLTEQWNKGKLPEGDYYIKRRNGYLPYDNIDSHGVWRNSIDEDIYEVLAPVPSYEEWQKVLNIDFNNEVLRLENAKLKELLKECRDYLEDDSPLSMRSMIEEIDNAIGEK